MDIAREVRRRARRMTVPILGAVFVCYFAVHAIHGDRGVITLMQLRKQAEAAEAELAGVRAERAELERKIALLRSEGIDPDMLDERARIMTGLAFPGDLILTEDGGAPAR